MTRYLLPIFILLVLILSTSYLFSSIKRYKHFTDIKAVKQSIVMYTILLILIIVAAVIAFAVPSPTRAPDVTRSGEAVATINAQGVLQQVHGMKIAHQTNFLSITHVLLIITMVFTLLAFILTLCAYIKCYEAQHKKISKKHSHKK